MTDTPSKPMHPYAILALAIVLPGSGHVFSGVPARGLQFLFFMIVIGWATSKIAPDQASFLGRYAGGFFIYALSIFDAYKIARIKWETWRYARGQKPVAADVSTAARAQEPVEDAGGDKREIDQSR